MRIACCIFLLLYTFMLGKTFNKQMSIWWIWICISFSQCFCNPHMFYDPFFPPYILTTHILLPSMLFKITNLSFMTKINQSNGKFWKAKIYSNDIITMSLLSLFFPGWCRKCNKTQAALTTLWRYFLPQLYQLKKKSF